MSVCDHLKAATSNLHFLAFHSRLSLRSKQAPGYSSFGLLWGEISSVNAFSRASYSTSSPFGINKARTGRVRTPGGPRIRLLRFAFLGKSAALLRKAGPLALDGWQASPPSYRGRNLPLPIGIRSAPRSREVAPELRAALGGARRFKLSAPVVSLLPLR